MSVKIDYSDRYSRAETFREFVARAEENRDLWESHARRASVDPAAVERAEAVGGKWHLLVMTEDWCGDGVTTLPALAALADSTSNLDLRIIGRDENPDVMDSHLTNGSRSIPIAILLDRDFEEWDWWGPRPSELQAWYLAEGRTLDATSRYREVRRWFARDQGRTTVAEVLEMLERAARREAA